MSAIWYGAGALGIIGLAAWAHSRMGVKPKDIVSDVTGGSNLPDYMTVPVYQGAIGLPPIPRMAQRNRAQIVPYEQRMSNCGCSWSIH